MGPPMGAAAAPRTPLLWAAALLAIVTGALHLYFAFTLFSAEYGLQLAFVGMGVIYFVGAALGLTGWKHDLVIKGAMAWVVLLIITWALGAAYGRTPNVEPIAFVDKAIEAVLLVVLFLLMRESKEAAQPSAAARG